MNTIEKEQDDNSNVLEDWNWKKKSIVRIRCHLTRVIHFPSLSMCVLNIMHIYFLWNEIVHWNQTTTQLWIKRTNKWQQLQRKNALVFHLE